MGEEYFVYWPKGVLLSYIAAENDPRSLFFTISSKQADGVSTYCANPLSGFKFELLYS